MNGFSNDNHFSDEDQSRIEVLHEELFADMDNIESSNDERPADTPAPGMCSSVDVRILFVFDFLMKNYL
eukprot:CAMPEP_0116838776 /NCGR_PEP_ID=MMETSP0418-20121206/9398_1 /TAXON_ID=1158023 /ORGANISM="Astrosyne radiata, Strain 13vi08-1A" /LENGTH=68 /DNA_ID=CAMNT_0004468811 /DNA_START=238 /DNA_END=440 /DNA_ORIENTATION=-